ncbi:hypothetical protein RFN28_12495 [Mesorhizobium sp. VK24D]|uniref:Uncharacterized protein n=1 Tax=Mesorhizobium album TaxID=3072314 RepID=A0ABU4XX57_9HYPH|nr:hypothetical protein [Mesorhizobium sp. VK24D]MDX8479291.1 hypothetical protein [Mesorhizobium sp. VK24D]
MAAMRGKQSEGGSSRHRASPPAQFARGHHALNDTALHKALGIVMLLRISSTNGAIVTGRLL